MRINAKNKAIMGNVLVGAAVGSVVGFATLGINRRTKAGVKKFLKAKVSHIVDFVDTAEQFIKTL